MIGELAEAVLGPARRDVDLEPFLRCLGEALDARHALVFVTPLADLGYSQPADYTARWSSDIDDELPAELTSVAMDLDGSRPVESHLLRIPVAVRQRLLGNLLIVGRADHDEWSSARRRLAHTAALLLGAAIGRRRTETRLRDSTRLMEQFAGSMREVVFLRHIQPSYMVFVNEAYETVWGDSVASLYEDPDRFLQFVHPDDVSRVRANMARVEQGEPVRHEYRLVRADGEQRWVRAETFPVRNDRGEVYRVAGLIEDITERRHAEERRRRREKRQRDALVREVHHRIKNSLQGIMGLIQQELGAYPGLESVMDSVLGKVRSIAIVHGLQCRDAHDDIYLCEIVEAIATVSQTVLGRQIEVQLDMNVDTPLKIDPDETVSMALVLNELITNAVKHSPDNGYATPVRVFFGASDNSGMVRVTNSVLQPPPDMDFRTGEGLGTGLELVKALLPRAGVDLDIHYEPDEKAMYAELTVGPPVATA